MNNQQILENAPEDATHVHKEYYLKLSDHDIWYDWSNESQIWIYADSYELDNYYSIRSLQDIKRIVELEKENAKLIQAGCDLCFYAEGTEEHRLAREKFPCRYD